MNFNNTVPTKISSVKYGDTIFLKNGSVEYVLKVTNISECTTGDRVNIRHSGGEIKGVSLSAHVELFQSKPTDQIQVSNIDRKPEINFIVEQGTKWITVDLVYCERDLLNGTKYAEFYYEGKRFHGSADTRYEQGIFNIKLA